MTPTAEVPKPLAKEQSHQPREVQADRAESQHRPSEGQGQSLGPQRKTLGREQQVWLQEPLPWV